MADTSILERLKERWETDKTDHELDTMIDNVNAEIIRLHGLHYDAATPLTELFEGGDSNLFPRRPIDSIVSVTETVWDVETVLSTNDYRVWYNGRMLERLNTGTNPRWYWGTPVSLVYLPINDNFQRQEIIIKVCILDLQYNASESTKIGDYAETFKDYQKERVSLLRSLNYAPGMVYR